MKHYKKGTELLKASSIVSPEKTTIDGRVCLAFKDIVHNLAVTQIKGLEFSDSNVFTEKVKTTFDTASKSEHPMSHRHRKRLLRQSKKLYITGV